MDLSVLGGASTLDIQWWVESENVSLKKTFNIITLFVIFFFLQDIKVQREKSNLPRAYSEFVAEPRWNQVFWPADQCSSDILPSWQGFPTQSWSQISFHKGTEKGEPQARGGSKTPTFQSLMLMSQAQWMAETSGKFFVGHGHLGLTQSWPKLKANLQSQEQTKDGVGTARSTLYFFEARTVLL